MPWHGAGIRRALHIVLPAQRIEPRPFAADVAGEQRQVNERHRIVGAVRVLGNAQRPVNRRVLRRRVHARRLNDQITVDPGNRLGVFGSEFLH